MKKLVIDIRQQRFELESRGAEEDAFIQATARELVNKIEVLRLQHGIADSTRASLLAALLIALETKKGDNIPVLPDSFGNATKTMGEQIDKVLTRTSNDSSAKANS